MKKVISLFMAVVMLFSLTAGIDFSASAAEGYDNEYIEYNIKCLKNYINVYGNTNSDGNKFIKYTDTNDCTYGIVYDISLDSLTFLMLSSSQGIDSGVSMNFYGPSTTFPQTWYYFEYDAIEATASLNVAEYTYDTELLFRSDNGNYLSGDDIHLCNLGLQVAMYGWDELVYDAIGGTMAMIGFSGLCTQHNNVQTNSVSPTCTSDGSTSYICANCGKISTLANFATGHNFGNGFKSCLTCRAANPNYTIPEVTLSTTSYTYDGKVKKPSVTVKDSNGTKISSSNYSVSYAKGRKYVGKYAVKVKFKGNYSGTKTVYFTIKPKSTSISSLKAGKKKFNVKWKKQTSQTSGYQIQYSTSSKFKSPKYVTVSGNKNTSKTVSKLKAKKKYYVRVRTYKTVKVNGKSTKIYSSWSKTKTVTTKK